MCFSLFQGRISEFSKAICRAGGFCQSKRCAPLGFHQINGYVCSSIFIFEHTILRFRIIVLHVRIVIFLMRIVVFRVQSYRSFMGGLSLLHGRIIGERSTSFVNVLFLSVFGVASVETFVFHQSLLYLASYDDGVFSLLSALKFRFEPHRFCRCSSKSQNVCANSLTHTHPQIGNTHNCCYC